jgi:hypothetical protein
MNRLGEDTRLPIVNIREGDVGILLGFPIGGLLFGASTGVDLLGVTGLLVGVFVSVTAMYSSSLNGWLSLFRINQGRGFSPDLNGSGPQTTSPRW